MNYTQIAISAVEALIQNGPMIVADIKALLAPIKEGRAPTDTEWVFAEQQIDIANTTIQTISKR
ncbi:hypothetical protein ACI01nite_24900 [Acetobacter cibinongensis]|uniref:Uncharacterized protein n=1 Tax=Acetobacter cibinongensis TaxID=146475 RepID=A0A0D6N6F6_9PROT|nr:hypothetical protein [Acetobacter cibinongensis]GAN61617.1 hypothetical protein Abci_046_050 [Acetobacter cibinongensis]GBQ17572.1 hypothetical protein AA0482_1948 [Acetobacter cibinongensis NRIC 0482]GEL59888.1 hypothetical protein ACI01nite_24900 [Acetobacter cibinongensis]